MFAWFSDLTARERRTMVACFGGWSLDALDVQIFSFVIPSLLALWHISTAQAGELGTITLLISAFGGWLAGALSDRWGRVRVLQITIVWYAFFTFLCGFAQDFTQLFIFRALQGLGFGGEWAAGAVLIGEVIQDRYRGRAVGLVQTGWSIGWGAAALLYTLLIAVSPKSTRGAPCSGSALPPRAWCSGSAATSRSRKSAATARPRPASCTSSRR
jgi:MFS family permease